MQVAAGRSLPWLSPGCQEQLALHKHALSRQVHGRICTAIAAAGSQLAHARENGSVLMIECVQQAVGTGYLLRAAK